MLRVREFARLTGVTVRTLHHYDRIGLLKPKGRTAAGYRLYEATDIERLEQVCALKYLGLSLVQIRTLLDRSPADITKALRTQRRLLEEKRTVLDRAIRAIVQAEQELAANDDASALLRNIIEVIATDTNQDWMRKYTTEEARVKLESRKQLWSPELQERVSRQWAVLIADVERSLAVDPASETAKALAARWHALVDEFTGRNKDIEASVAHMWADRKNWPTDIDQKAPVITRHVWDFIAEANAAL